MMSGLRIETGRTVDPSTHYLAVRPEDIIISRETFSSSIRNNYLGIATKINNQGFIARLLRR